MILRSLDRIVSVYCPNAHVRLYLANVTDTARTLERNHLCGPVAGLVQAELVAGGTLLGTLLDAPGQSISLRLQFPDGLLGGATMNCAYGYDLRGYTRQKVLATLDESAETDEALFDRALGRTVKCAVVRSDGHGGSTNAVFDLNYKDRLTITDIVEEYFCTSLQRRALVQLSAATKQGYVECAHALMVEFLPEATDACAAAIEAKFTDGSAQDALDSGMDIRGFVEFFDLDAPTNEESHPVRFYCPCSSERVMAMLKGLPRADIEALIAEDKPTDIFCHMCGKGYTITPDQLRTVLAE